MFTSREFVEMLRREYPSGTKVECISMDDSYHPVPSGTKGIVSKVDDGGTIHVSWENGSSLGLIYGEDIFRKI